MPDSSYSIPYILKPDDQLFFLHIPKTAGTTLISLLDQHFLEKEICPEQLIHKVKRLSASDMARYRLIRGHLDYDLYKLLPKKPVYITMLRDPIKRVISLYNHWKRNIDNLLIEHPPYEREFREAINSGLYTFICFQESFIRHEVENNQVRRIVSNTDDPLYARSDREYLEIAKKRISEEFLFVGFLEKFDESIQLLCYSLGWMPVRSYERKMVSPNPTRLEDISTRARDAIIERNQLDIELYNYSADLFQERYQSMIHQLIDNSYQEHFILWNYPKNKTEIYIGQYESAIGWYPVENTQDQKTFAWMGPRREAFIDVRLPKDRELSIALFVVNSIHSELLSNLKLLANNVEIELKKVNRDGFLAVFEGVITKDTIDLNESLTRISLHVPRTYSPIELDQSSNDPRQLSIAIHKVIFEVVGESINGEKSKSRNLFLHQVEIIQRILTNKKD